MPQTPVERTLQSVAAINTRWARTADRSAATAPARNGLLRKFERQVDPDGLLDDNERARRADNARRAFYARLALRSAQTRRRAREAAQAAADADAVARAAGIDPDEIDPDSAA